MLVALLLSLDGTGWAQPLPSPVLDDDEQTTWRQVRWSDFRDTSPRKVDSRSVVRGRGDDDRRIGAWLHSAIQLDRVELVVSSEGDGRWSARPADWRVYALMDKRRSGYADDPTDEMLVHEQRHFDLAELCARRFRHEIGSLRASAGSRAKAQKRLMQQLTDAHRQLGRHFRLLQQRYDGETDHGLDRRRQRKWNQRVSRWLAQDVPKTCDG